MKKRVQKICISMLKAIKGAFFIIVSPLYLLYLIGNDGDRKSKTDIAFIVSLLSLVFAVATPVLIWYFGQKYIDTADRNASMPSLEITYTKPSKNFSDDTGVKICNYGKKPVRFLSFNFYSVPRDDTSKDDYHKYNDIMFAAAQDEAIKANQSVANKIIEKISPLHRLNELYYENFESSFKHANTLILSGKEECLNLRSDQITSFSSNGIEEVMKKRSQFIHNDVFRFRVFVSDINGRKYVASGYVTVDSSSVFSGGTPLITYIFYDGELMDYEEYRATREAAQIDDTY